MKDFFYFFSLARLKIAKNGKVICLATKILYIQISKYRYYYTAVLQLYTV